jgi:uncharacterized protein (DUF433 family)
LSVISRAAILSEKITKSPGVCGGRACVAGHRVRVSDIAVLYEHNRLTPDEIATQYPSLTLGDIHAALSYYYDNFDEIRQERQQERDFAEEFKRTNSDAADWRQRRLSIRDVA